MSAEWFGARLKELREQRGWSQKEVAVRAGLGQRSVSSWEQYAREPSWSNVVALAEALGVDCLAFLQEPAERPATPRGRPRKGTDRAPERAAAKGKRPAGRRPKGR
jgi:transcriptional regulator with XRE-family HTH domain